MRNQDTEPVNPADHDQHSGHGKEQVQHRKKITRRALVASLGMAGATIASGGFVHTIIAAGNPHDKIGELSDLQTTDKTNLVSAINENVTQLAEKANEIEVLKKKTRGFVSVLEYGADPTGVNDSTQAFKDAVAYVRDTIIATNFQTSLLVLIPGGIYKITGKVTISPFVHLELQGFVKIESSVSNDSTIHFTAQAGDPSFTNLMNRQEYQSSPWINAASGGLLIKSTLNRTTTGGGSIGLEVGSKTDLGGLKPTSRYVFSHVNISGFDISVQMNKYNHYLGAFEYCHFELNNTLVRFGDTVSNVINSGENMMFKRCIFAGAKTAFHWLVDGMDCNFISCSFDFIDRMWFVERGYKRIYMSGGHIEGIGRYDVGDVTHGMNTENDRGMVVSTIPTGDAAAIIVLNAPIIFNNKGKQIKGSKLSVRCHDVRWERTTRLLKEDDTWVAGDEVNVFETGYSFQGHHSNISRSLGILSNSDFSLIDTSGGDVSTIAGWTVGYGGGMVAPIVTQNIPASNTYTKAMQLTGNASDSTRSYATVETPNFYRVNQGEQLMYSVAINPNAISNGTGNILLSAKVMFYDEADNKIGETADYLDNNEIAVNEWQRVGGASTVVPQGCTKVKIRYTFSRLTSNTTLYATGFYMRKG
jgi:hypothetical protein